VWRGRGVVWCGVVRCGVCQRCVVTRTGTNCQSRGQGLGRGLTGSPVLLSSVARLVWCGVVSLGDRRTKTGSRDWTRTRTSVESCVVWCAVSTVRYVGQLEGLLW
jgi:hypothetical protein